MKLDYQTLHKVIEEMYSLGLEDLIFKEPETLSDEESDRINLRLKEIESFIVKSGWTEDEYMKANWNELMESSN